MNEERNTFNSIADRPLLITSGGCKWGFHKWQKWSNVISSKDYTRTINLQYRYCDSCNIYDARKVDGLVHPNRS